MEWKGKRSRKQQSGQRSAGRIWGTGDDGAKGKLGETEKGVLLALRYVCVCVRACMPVRVCVMLNASLDQVEPWKLLSQGGNAVKCGLEPIEKGPRRKSWVRKLPLWGGNKETL